MLQFFLLSSHILDDKYPKSQFNFPFFLFSCVVVFGWHEPTVDIPSAVAKTKVSHSTFLHIPTYENMCDPI